MQKILLKFLRITANYTGTTTVACKIYRVNVPYAGLKDCKLGLSLTLRLSNLDRVYSPQ